MQAEGFSVLSSSESQLFGVLLYSHMAPDLLGGNLNVLDHFKFQTQSGLVDMWPPVHRSSP